VILLIDNFDSFVYNLARYFEELGEETVVVRNDALTTADVRALAPAAIVISPGPCDPARAGVSLDVIREMGPRVPILGVCLGHQAIGAAYGGLVLRGQPCHGRSSRIFHQGGGVFAGIPSPFSAARYHSLVVSPVGLPAELEVTALTGDGTVMGLRHRKFPVFGVQFHPESVLTEHGHRLLRNFLDEARRFQSGKAAKSAVVLSESA
jgi:anthranilate synthase/aminodeoxychorismate synthase-like glutamine amidotransferase